MMQYITGPTVKNLREKKGLTQKQLAEKLAVSDKTVSKWETGRGLPDITLLEPLAAALSVSVAELLSGDCVVNRNRSGSMARGQFYVCPVCGNVVWALGSGAFSCCGIQLPPQEAEAPDAAHTPQTEPVENEIYLTLQHPMTKEHFISFFAMVSSDGVTIKKLYPEQEAAVRLPAVRGIKVYAFCNRHGLFELKV